MTPPTTKDVDRSKITTSSIPCETPLPMLVNGSNLRVVRTVGANISIRVVNIWHQSKVKVNHLLRSPPPVACGAHKSTHSLPYEIVEMIIAHLVHDHRALVACSLTCRSWYIIAASRIHHTLFLWRGFHHDRLKPLFKLHGLGLVPLVQEIRVEQSPRVENWLVPQTFGHRNLHYFSAFAKVHTLGLQRLDICRFFPHIKRHF